MLDRAFQAALGQKLVLFLFHCFYFLLCLSNYCDFMMCLITGKVNGIKVDVVSGISDLAANYGLIILLGSG